LARILGGQADHYDGNEGGNETRDDFIHARATHEAAVPAQGDPDHYSRCTHDHTGNGTGAVGAGPHQGQQDQRAEGGTEACPGVTDQGQNLGVRVRGDDRSYQTNGYNAGTADVYALFVSRFFAQEQAIEILCQRGRRYQLLTGDGAHDRRQQGCVKEDGDQRVEQQIRQDDEDGFRVGDVHTVTNGVRTAEDTQGDGTDQGDRHPAHADIPSGRNIFQGTDCHEAHDD